MKRAIITGPTGAIGMALIEVLTSVGIEVVAVVRRNSSRADRIKENNLVKKVYCDLSELEKLPDMIGERADVFFHLGWDGTGGGSRNDMYIQNNNVKYALDAVEAAYRLGCTRFVGAGSQAEYGRYEGKLSAETPTRPENGYGMAKLCAGQMTRALCEQKGMEHIWARILSVYGPYDGEHTLVMSVIKRLMECEPAECTKAEQLWDYIYSKDAAKALYLLGEKGVNSKIYCVGSGQAKPLREYIEYIRECVNPTGIVKYGAIPYSKNQVMYLCADIEQLKKDTGYVSQYTWEQGIKETVNMIKNTKVS